MNETFEELKEMIENTGIKNIDSLNEFDEIIDEILNEETKGESDFVISGIR